VNTKRQEYKFFFCWNKWRLVSLFFSHCHSVFLFLSCGAAPKMKKSYPRLCGATMFLTYTRTTYFLCLVSMKPKRKLDVWRHFSYTYSSPLCSSVWCSKSKRLNNMHLYKALSRWNNPTTSRSFNPNPSRFWSTCL